MFVLQTTHRIVTEELRDRIRFLEAELSKQQDENKNLVNALASQNRGVIPFKSEPKKFKFRIPARSVFQMEKQLTRARVSDEGRDYPKEFKSE